MCIKLILKMYFSFTFFFHLYFPLGELSSLGPSRSVFQRSAIAMASNLVAMASNLTAKQCNEFQLLRYAVP